MTKAKFVIAATAAAALCLPTSGSFAQTYQDANYLLNRTEKGRYESLISNVRKNSFEAFSKSDRSKLKKISRKAQSNKRFRFKLAKNPTSVAKQYGLSPKGFKLLTAKVNAEDLGKGTAVQSGCLCTHCCVTTINSKPGQDRVQHLNKKANYLKASPTFKQIR